jgi:hypothetical protein
VVLPIKNQRKGALNDMIDKVKFTAKNLTSNAGVLPLLLKTLIYGGFVGADKLERFLLLKAEQFKFKEIRKEPLKDTILWSPGE